MLSNVSSRNGSSPGGSISGIEKDSIFRETGSSPFHEVKIQGSKADQGLETSGGATMKEGEVPQIAQSATCAPNTHRTKGRAWDTKIFYNKLREEGIVHPKDQKKANGRSPRVTPKGRAQEKTVLQNPHGLR